MLHTYRVLSTSTTPSSKCYSHGNVNLSIERNQRITTPSIDEQGGHAEALAFMENVDIDKQFDELFTREGQRMILRETECDWCEFDQSRFWSADVRDYIK